MAGTFPSDSGVLKYLDWRGWVRSPLRWAKRVPSMLAVGSQPPLDADGVSRRDFLRFGGLGVLGLSAAEQRARAEANGKGLRRCIFVLLNGGPSPFETFDPKPAARGDLRGPYRAIATATPGLQLSELLPSLAER